MAEVLPIAMKMLANGMMEVRWASAVATPESVGLSNNLFGGTLNFQYGIVGSSILPPTLGEARGKVVGQGGGRHIIQADNAVTHLEVSVAVNQADSGAANTYNWITPNNAANAAPLARFASNPALDFNAQRLTQQTLVGANDYQGTTTDIRLGFEDPTAQISANNFSDTQSRIAWSWSGGRNSRLKPGRSYNDITVTVTPQGGSPVVVTHTGHAAGINPRFNLNRRLIPTDVVTVDIPDGTFELSQSNQANYVFDCVHTQDVPVRVFVTWPEPQYTHTTVVDNGTKVRHHFDIPVANENFIGSLPEDFGGDIVTLRSASPLAVAADYIEWSVTSPDPIYEGETIDFGTINGNLVRNADAPPGLGRNSSFNPSPYTVVGGGAPPPVPILIGAQINPDGTSLQLTWTRPADYYKGTGVLKPTFSPIGNQNFDVPDFGNGGTQWTYLLDPDPIRVGDTVTLDATAMLAMDQVSGEGSAAVTDFPVVNGSTQPYDKPVLELTWVLADGQSIQLDFDRPVVVNDSILEANYQVLAQDIIDQAPTREFSVVPGTATLIDGDTKLQVAITGAGTIFGNGLGGPGDPDDGDSAKHNTNGFAGIVSSKLSAEAGQPALLDPIPGAAGDWDTSLLIVNNSQIVEPTGEVIPTYVEAQVFDQGDSPVEQFLRIRFDDGAGTPVKLQDNVTLPILSGSLTGLVSLTFDHLQAGAGDNDEIVYKVVGELLKRSADGEVITLTIPEGIVVSDSTGDPNPAFGPITDGDPSFTNDSTIPQPVPAETPPHIQQIIVGSDGFLVGIYYDVEINAVGGAIETDSTVTSEKTGNFTVNPSPAQKTLATFKLEGDVPIFREESVLVDVPSGLVSGIVNGLSSIAASQLLAENNSLIPVPLPPIVDSASVNDPGDLIQLIFSVPVVEGTGAGYVVSSLSGRNEVTIASISNNVVNLNVAGIIYENEDVELFLEADFVKEATYEFTSNEKLRNYVVDTSGRTAAAPDLPGNAPGLNPGSLI